VNPLAGDFDRLARLAEATNSVIRDLGPVDVDDPAALQLRAANFLVRQAGELVCCLYRVSLARRST
jgi:hypothetical protein